MRFWLSLINYHTRSNYLNIPNSLNNKFNFLCNSLNEHSNSLNNKFNFLCNSLNIQTFKFLTHSNQLNDHAVHSMIGAQDNSYVHCRVWLPHFGQHL